MEILKANAFMCDDLTRITFQSKDVWTYPKDYYDAWKNSLTITGEYIIDNDVFYVSEFAKLIGYYALANNNNEYVLEHLYIAPKYIQLGIGTMLIDHLKVFCRLRKISRVVVFADKNSSGFFEKMGAKKIGELSSEIDEVMLDKFELSI